MKRQIKMNRNRLEELAAGRVAGGLDRKEKREFQRLLSIASDAEKAGVASILNTAALAASALPRANAPFRVFQKLMPRVLKQARTMDAAAIAGGLKFVEGNDRSAWLSLPIPGVSFKLLSLDRAKDYAVVLAKLDPGATYPAHMHFGPEEIYMLSGDLWIGEVKLWAGDFHTAAPGSRHEVNRSDGGCVIIYVISKKDLAAQLAAV